MPENLRLSWGGWLELYVVLESRRCCDVESVLCLGITPESKLLPVLGRVDVAPVPARDLALGAISAPIAEDEALAWDVIPA